MKGVVAHGAVIDTVAIDASFPDSCSAAIKFQRLAGESVLMDRQFGKVTGIVANLFAGLRFVSLASTATHVLSGYVKMTTEPRHTRGLPDNRPKGWEMGCCITDPTEGLPNVFTEGRSCLQQPFCQDEFRGNYCDFTTRRLCSSAEMRGHVEK